MRTPALILISLLLSACSGRWTAESGDTAFHPTGELLSFLLFEMNGDARGVSCYTDGCEPQDRDHERSVSAGIWTDLGLLVVDYTQIYKQRSGSQLLIYFELQDGVPVGLWPEKEVEWYSWYSHGDTWERTCCVDDGVEGGFSAVVSAWNPEEMIFEGSFGGVFGDNHEMQLEEGSFGFYYDLSGDSVASMTHGGGEALWPLAEQAVPTAPLRGQ